VIELAAIEAARERVKDVAVRTPLIRLDVGPDGTEIYLKLETLQPIGSFKIRGAANAVRAAPPASSAKGLVTASAGNMAQGVAYMARELGVPATIVVPEHAPQAKLGAVQRLGGEVVRVPYDAWWQMIVSGRVEGSDGLFVHPVQDDNVMAGNGTIGLELLEQLPDADAVVIPFGGGGLTVGIASAIRALRPQTKVFTAEPATGAALAAALRAGAPTDVDYQPSFVDGSGSRRVLDGMWSRVSALVDGAVAVPIETAASALRLMAERIHVIAEGAGALALAAALAGDAGRGKIVCIVSGGNIDFSTLSEILAAPERAASPGGEG
jgi:threonine dehydratase